MSNTTERTQKTKRLAEEIYDKYLPYASREIASLIHEIEVKKSMIGFEHDLQIKNIDIKPDEIWIEHETHELPKPKFDLYKEINIFDDLMKRFLVECLLDWSNETFNTACENIFTNHPNQKLLDSFYKDFKHNETVYWQEKFEEFNPDLDWPDKNINYDLGW